MRKAVFLDKDGVINSLVERPDGRMTSPWTLEEFKQTLFPHIKESIQILKELDYLVFVVTNQPGVLDGEMYMTELDDICGYLEEELGIDHVLYALKKDSPVYKPNKGMFESLIRTYDVDTMHSVMIGDRWKDMVPARDCQVPTIYVGENCEFPEGYDKEYYRPNVTVSTSEEAFEMFKKYRSINYGIR